MCNCKTSTDRSNNIKPRMFSNISSLSSDSDIIAPISNKQTTFQNNRPFTQELNSKFDGFLPNNYNFGLEDKLNLQKEDSLLNYTKTIDSGKMSFEEYGKFLSLSINYNLDYPNLMSYSEDTQAQVIASTFRKIGVKDYELPYKKIYQLAKEYSLRPGFNHHECIKKCIAEGLFTQTQANYIEKIITSISTGEDTRISKNASAIQKLNIILDSIKADSSVTEKEFEMLSATITMAKQIDINTGLKPTNSTVVLIDDGKPINCKDCINRNLLFIAAALIIPLAIVATAAVGFLTLTGIIIAANPTLGVLFAMAGGFGMVQLINLFGTYAVWQSIAAICGNFCADHNGGIIECDVCPWYTYFFDGANCYLGWYHSNRMGWVYGDAFWYYGDTALGCSDGHLNSSWGYVPFNAGGHGVYSGGGACLFGYNYNTSFEPWVSSSGFYLKPKCKQIF